MKFLVSVQTDFLIGAAGEVNAADGEPLMNAEIFQAVERVRMESCLAQAVLPLVGLAADKVTRDRYIFVTL